MRKILVLINAVAFKNLLAFWKKGGQKGVGFSEKKIWGWAFWEKGGSINRTSGLTGVKNIGRGWVDGV